MKATISELLKYRFEGRKLVNGDGTIFQALERYAYDDPDRTALNQYIHAGQLISEALPTAKSIDHFLNSHKGKRHVEDAASWQFPKQFWTPNETANYLSALRRETVGLTYRN